MNLKFEDWKDEVINIMKELHWTEAWISSVDWSAWKDCYYDNDLSPREAIQAECEAAS
jgi:hypothetical protein